MKFGSFIRNFHQEIIAVGTLFIAAFTVILALATAFLYVATRDLVKGAEETAERQLRAYVLPSSGSIDFRPEQIGERFSALIVFKNSGQTPAYDFSGSGDVTFSAFPLRAPLDNVTQPTFTAVIGPGLEYHFNLTAEGITQPMWTGILAGAAALYVHGSYKYRDAFKKMRRGNFRFYYGGKDGLRKDRALTFYVEGNDAD